VLRYAKPNLSAWYFIIAALIVNFSTPGSADTLFTADDPRINYYGRFDFTDPLSPRWNWSGSTIEARFTGPSIGFGLVDGKADYDVEIDGVIDTIIRTKDTLQRYTIGTGFSDAMHTIRIVQRSENHASAATFKGFYLSQGKILGNAPTKPSRKIEFIGNSDLVAYGVESTVSKCNDNQIRLYTNTNLSFGTLIAKLFDAQSVILGWSGKGLVRNWDSPSKRSSTSFPAYYDKTLGMLDVKWDFTKWIPDLVVIELGWNDFTSSPPDAKKYPDDSMYVGDYHKFITVIRNHYPNAAVLCVATHGIHCVEYTKQVVAEETTSLKHPKVFYAEYPLDESLALAGCNSHPSPNDQRIIAEALGDTIKKRLGWDMAKVSVRTMPYCPRAAISTPAIKAWMDARQFFISGAASSELEITILIRTIDGRTIRQEKIDRNNRIVISLATLPAGVYFIGNLITGWKRFAIMR
jgi:hypothetical protein